MKRIKYHLTAILLCHSLMLDAQSYDRNFTRVQSLKVQITDPASIPSPFENGSNITISYTDGLNRPVQVVSQRTSPNEKDLVQFTVYDADGRRTKSYLPYSTSDNFGFYRQDPSSEQAIFFGTALKVSHTAYPYSVSRYDNSPSDRILEASTPGYSWRMQANGSGNTNLVSYDFNAPTDNVRQWEVSGNNAVTQGFYSANELYKTIQKDENRHLPNGGKETILFTDKNGKSILKKEIISSTATLLTYYVYDDFGNLRFVIPPKASATIPSSGYWCSTVAQTTDNDLIFYYKYDDKQRMIEKKVPGKLTEYFAYDQLDRVKMFQDGNLRNNNQFYFYEYDVLGRVVDEGLMSNNTQTLDQLQSTLDALTGPLYEQPGEPQGDGYTDQSYPSMNNQNLPSSKYKIFYYDKYPSFITGNFLFHNHNEFPENYSDRISGALTASKIRVLQSTEKWLTEVYYYDKKGRILQKISDNTVGGIDVVYNQYRFDGALLKTLIVHNFYHPSNFPMHQILYTYEYDNGGRIINIFEKIDNEADGICIAHMTYNELGQLIQKSLHKKTSDTKFLQCIDYAYNPKGWLTAINNSNLTNTNIFSQGETNLLPDYLVTSMSLDSIRFTTSVFTDKNNLKNLVINFNDYKSLKAEHSDSSNNYYFFSYPENQTRNYIEGVTEDEEVFLRLVSYTDLSFKFGMNGLTINENSDIAAILDSISNSVQAQLPIQGLTDQDAVETVSKLVNTYFYNRLAMVFFNRNYDDLFGENLTYDAPPVDQQQCKQYNGNIGSMSWQVNGYHPGERRYTYEYDRGNRLINATYASRINGLWPSPEDGRYSMTGLTYDENGNIGSLERNGQSDLTGGGHFGPIDNLTYGYKGNRLDYVSEGISTPTTMPDFHELSTLTGNEYAYDANGNMVVDNNKGITQIVYNFLNLPAEIYFGANFKTIYLYDASGRKISKTVVKNNIQTSFTEYSGGYIYQDGQLTMVSTPEGRLVTKTGGAFDRQYFLKDHLGNIRVVFQEDQTNHTAMIVQEDHFDPFGMKLGGLTYISNTPNLHLYQGKELQDEAVDVNNDNVTDAYLNWYDFDARYFDVQLARWHVPDPASQCVSPYAAMGNNPVSNVDPTGMSYVWSEASYWKRINHFDGYKSGGHLGPVNNLRFDSKAWAKDLRQEPPVEVSVVNPAALWLEDVSAAWEYDQNAAVYSRFEDLKEKIRWEEEMNKQKEQEQTDFKNVLAAVEAQLNSEIYQHSHTGLSSFAPGDGDPPNQGQGGETNAPYLLKNSGFSFDITLAIPGFGFSLEMGIVYDKNGNSSLYSSSGLAYGFEFSAGYNYFKSFKDIDFKNFSGPGLSVNATWRWASLGYFGDTRNGYPTDQCPNTFWGFKAGGGVGVGFGSYSVTKTYLLPPTPFIIPHHMR